MDGRPSQWAEPMISDLESEFKKTDNLKPLSLSLSKPDRNSGGEILVTNSGQTVSVLTEVSTVKS